MSEPEYPPYTFADPKGRRWALKISYDLKESIKETTGINIDRAAIGGLKAIAELLDDGEKFCQALWILVEAQAKAAEVTPDQFIGCFEGETFEAAELAMQEAVVLFTKPHSRENLRAALEKGKRLAERTVGRAIEKIDVESESSKLIEQCGSAQAS